MLSWIFWHTRFPEVPEDDYVAALRAFHQRITDASPEGFLGVRTLRYDGLPWLPSPAEVHEDWYFVRDSAALDVLDDAVLAAFTSDSHARVSGLAANAVAGLYRLRAGTPAVQPHCSWLSKPRDTSYDAFMESFATARAVWSRKMVLGPTPEFCIEK